MASWRVAHKHCIAILIITLAWGCQDGEQKSSMRATGASTVTPGKVTPRDKGSNAKDPVVPDDGEDRREGVVTPGSEEPTSPAKSPGAETSESDSDTSTPELPADPIQGEAENPPQPEVDTVEDVSGGGEVEDDEPKRPRSEEDIFKSMPSGADQLKVLCARAGQDRVRKVFCSQNPPAITNLQELQKALGLGIVDPTRVGRNNNGAGGNAAFTFIAGSSSLVAKYTSSINPRLIMFDRPTGNNIPDLVALGFVRGEQFAEIAARDPSTGQMNFFVVKFEQECNEEPMGCGNGDLLTPAIETEWRKLTVYEDTDLANTIFDCKQCHQPGGEGTPKMLRMQELRNPWTHFFRNNNAGGQSLIADYQAAHAASETYAGVPGSMIASSEPALLETLLRDNGFANQPNEFITGTIEREVRNSSPAQPVDNSKIGSSTTWQAAYDQFVKGLVIAPPYHDVKVTDPVKLKNMTAAYVSVMNGSTPPEMMPDIRDIFPDSAMRNLGFGVKEGLTGAEIIVQACAQCHNAKLQQNISRARFDVDLSKMSREEKDIAIARLKLMPNDPLRMPPTRFRTLTPDEIQRAVEELQK